MAKMGRPTTNPKDRIIKIRATKDDREKMLYCCEKLNTTQYEVVMQGINMVYEKINKGVCFPARNQINKLLAPKWIGTNIIAQYLYFGKPKFI